MKSEAFNSNTSTSSSRQTNSSLFTLTSSLNGSFIANGDRACIRRVRNVRELYGFRFADVWLQFPDYGDYELQATVMLDTLTSEAPH